MSDHVILVAFTVNADTRADAESELHTLLPSPRINRNLVEWWVAEDDRHDGSDNDSAVFVSPGWQGTYGAVSNGTNRTADEIKSHFEAYDSDGYPVVANNGSAYDEVADRLADARVGRR